MLHRYLIFLIFISTTVFSQKTNFDKNVDSIAVLYKNYKKTSNSEFSKLAFLLAQKTKSDSLISIINAKFGVSSFFNSDKTTIILSKENLKNLYLKNKDSSVLAQFYHIKGLEFRLLYRPDSAFYYLNRSKDISIALKDSLNVGKRLYTMAVLQLNEKDFYGSEASIIEGIKYTEHLKDYTSTVSLYKWLGAVLRTSDRSEESRKMYNKAYELVRFQKNYDSIREHGRHYNAIAKTYEREGNNLKAKEYYGLPLKNDSLKYLSEVVYKTSLEGYSYNNYMLGNKKSALRGYLEVLKIREKNKDETGIIYSHSLLGEVYTSLNNKPKALYHTKKALKLSRKLNNNERILENLFLLSKLVKGEQGRQYLQEHFILNDSLFKKERTRKNQFAKVRYEAEKKEQENLKLKDDNERKQLQLESEEQQKTIGWLLAGASILFIGFGTTVVANRRKKLLFESKLLQIEAREKERQQIAKSLHDEVAGDIRMLHKKLEQNNLADESLELNRVQENVRSLSHQLSSVSFDEVSFKDQIVNLVSDYFDADFMIRIKEINSVQWKEINNSIKRTLFLSIREGLQNIDKYATASKVVLGFNESKKTLFLTIHDNGKGFDISSKKKGIGLKNMKERVEEINGVFSIKSQKEKGTTLSIEIPKNGN